VVRETLSKEETRKYHSHPSNPKGLGTGRQDSILTEMIRGSLDGGSLRYRTHFSKRSFARTPPKGSSPEERRSLITLPVQAVVYDKSTTCQNRNSGRRRR